MDKSKTEAICTWPIPRNTTDLRSFLGFVNYYQLFLLNLAKLTQPLTPLTGKRKWEWTYLQDQAMDQIKEAVASERVLRIARNDLPYLIEVDASDFALGAVLLQEIDDQRHPIAFISKSLTETERNYTTYDKELYAIVFAFKEWRKYLLDTVSPTIILSTTRISNSIEKLKI
jgi:hypothetical protein